MPPKESTPESVSYDEKQLPKLLSLETAAFRKKYGEWVSFHDEVLPPDIKSERRGLASADRPGKHKEFMELFEDAPEMHRHLVHELSTMLREYEKCDNVVNGDPMWPHQKALLIEFIQMLVQKHWSGKEMQSFLLEEAPGSGKTRILGIVIAALSRMMVRGVLDQNILIAVKRKAIVMQQSLSKNEMRSVMLSTEMNTMRRREVREQRRYFLQEFSGVEQEFFPMGVWESLCQEEPANVEEAANNIEQSLRDRELWDQFARYPHHERVVSELARCMAQEGCIVLAPNGDDLEFLDLTNPDVVGEDESKGDLLFGVDQQVIDNGGVFIQSGFDAVRGEEGSLPSEKTRIAVMSLPSTYQHGVRVRMKDFLGNVGWIFVDEAGKNHPSGMQNMGVHEDIGGDTAHLFAATAYRETKHHDGNFSYFSVEDGINSDPQVLKNPRMRVFPGQESVRFPSGSYEAAEQLIAAYGERLKLADAARVPQPFEDGSDLIVVHRDLVTYLTLRLRQEYGDSETQFLSYNTNSKTEEHAGRIQLRMNDPTFKQTCLVGSMDRVVDSYDWRQLRATFMGVKESKASMEFMQRLYGRQFHSMLENGYIFQQLFADDDARNRLLWLAYHNDAGIPEEGPTEVVPGQFIIGEQQCKKEKSFANKHDVNPQEVWSSSTKAEFRDHVRTSDRGTFPPKEKQNPLSMSSFVIRFPQVAKNVPARQHAVGAPYVREFAAANGLEAHEEDLLLAVSGAGKQTVDRAEALRKEAIELKLIRLNAISSTARGAIMAAEKEIQANSISREQWQKSVEEEQGRSASNRGQVRSSKKNSGAKRGGSRKKKAKPPAKSYADRIANELAERDRNAGVVSEETFEPDEDEDTINDDLFDDDDDFGFSDDDDDYFSDY